MKKKLKKQIYYIFNFLYLIWTFAWCYITLEELINGKFEMLNIINSIFLCYGFYFFWNQK